MSQVKFFPLLLLSWTLILSACVSHNSPEVQNISPPAAALCDIAVLPLVNDSEYQQGGVIVYRIFVSELHKVKGLTISQEGDVRKLYRQMRIGPKDTPTLDDLKILADRLRVQGFVQGKVVKMRENKGRLEARPILALNFKMINAATGRTMMTIYNSRRGEDYRSIMHFGVVNTITELSRVVSDEIIRQWFPGGEVKCQ
ncbi:hypothetical protein ACOHYD_12480 [Desulfobacterota bacterium M19]